MEKILVFNAGSSSLKYKLFTIIDKENIQEINHGEVSAIGSSQGPRNHTVALQILFGGFGIRKGSLEDIEGLKAICHRVVYGGEEYHLPKLIDKKLIADLRKFNPLSPLHNPVILEVIKAVSKNNGKRGHRYIPNYAVFDSGYFINLPDHVKIYPLPYKFYSKYGVQKYGFHGLSHQYANQEIGKRFPHSQKNITIHLGAGCSITAILSDKPIDTSMGFTPLEGLMMGTRAGDLDPGIIAYLHKYQKISMRDLQKILNHESGLLGISQASSEMTDILYLTGNAVENSDFKISNQIEEIHSTHSEKAKLALKMFCYRIEKYIGAYAVALGGLDTIAFTGKIGYSSSIIRKLIAEKIKPIFPDCQIMAVPTNEEWLIAKKVLGYL